MILPGPEAVLNFWIDAYMAGPEDPAPPEGGSTGLAVGGDSTLDWCGATDKRPTDHDGLRSACLNLPNTIRGPCFIHRECTSFHLQVYDFTLEVL